MISAGLAVECRENGEALSILDFVVRLHVIELPAHKRVKKGVSGSGDEAAAPVSGYAKCFQILLALGWEEVEPLVGVLEVRDLTVCHANLFQDFVLSEFGLDHFRILL
jgi:hypothetical protein